MERRIREAGAGGLAAARRGPGSAATAQPTLRSTLNGRVAGLLRQRAQELVDLLLAEAALAPGRAVGLEIAHVRPAADRAERDAERVRRLRGRQAEGSSVDLPHERQFSRFANVGEGRTAIAQPFVPKITKTQWQWARRWTYEVCAASGTFAGQALARGVRQRPTGTASPARAECDDPRQCGCGSTTTTTAPGSPTASPAPVRRWCCCTRSGSPTASGSRSWRRCPSASGWCCPTCRCTATPRTGRAIPTAPDWLAEVIAGFCREVGGPRCTVAGHDVGAELALLAVSTGRLEPSRLVLMPNRLHRRDEFVGQAAGVAGGLPRGRAAGPRPPALPRRQAGVPPLARASGCRSRATGAARDLVRHAFADVGGNGNRARSWAKFARRWPVDAQRSCSTPTRR